MPVFEDMQFAREEAAKCMACGNCQEVCPVYLETHEEGSVARGKIKLVEALLNGLIDENTVGLEENLSLCLSCKACNEICPCGVEIDKIILAGRAAVVRKTGLPLLKNAIFNVVERPTLFNAGMRLGGMFQDTVFKKETDLKGYKPRFPFGLDMRRVVPELAAKPFRETVREVNRPYGETKHRVAFFTGCSSNYLYDRIGRSFMNVMRNNHVEVVVPKDQHCCGMPILSHGDAKTAKAMAVDHINRLKDLDVEYILTVCGSCALSFKEHYPDLLEGTPYYEDALALADKVMDWSDFLMNVVKPDLSNLHTAKMLVTYHDPCHLRRGIGVKDAPREILKALPDVTFVEMKHANRCCGSAGSFSLTNYDLSMDIQKNKVENIKNTGADVVATGCGSCIMQITDGQNRFGGRFRARHVVDILSEAYDVNRQKQAEKVYAMV